MLHKKYNYLLLFIIFLTHLFSFSASFEKRIIFQSVLNKKIIQKQKISLFEDNTFVGFLYYSKIPLVNIYIFHDLYVFPKYRNKGHAQYLLKNSLNYIQSKNSCSVYIQPGPFERDAENIKILSDPIEYKKRLDSLTHLYVKCGFKKTNRCTQLCAQILYKILNIPEDSNYLLVYHT